MNLKKDEAIKLAKSIKKLGGVGRKEVSLSNAEDDPLYKMFSKIKRLLKKL